MKGEPYGNSEDNSSGFLGQHDIVNDDGIPNPEPYHCLVNANNHILYSYPTLYESGTRMSSDTTFDVLRGGADRLVIKGVASGGGFATTFWATNGIGGGGISDWLTSPVAADPIPANKVDFYQPLTIQWFYGPTNKSVFVAAGTTTNQVYVSLAPPNTSPLYHTVAHLACSVPGATTQSQALENTWSLFSGLKVKTWDEQKLYYYSGSVSVLNEDVLWLLSSPAAPGKELHNGNCVAFARLLIASLGVNAVSAVEKAVTYNSGNEYAVKKVSFTPLNQPYPDPNYPFYHPIYGSGNQGQNNANPTCKIFTMHDIAYSSVTGIYYDPSYGITATGETDYTQQAIDGFGNSSSASYWQKAANTNWTVHFTNF